MTGIQVSPGLRARLAPGAITRRSVWSTWATPTRLIAAIALLGLGLRVYCLMRPGYLTGVTEYDDGSYFGSAVRLVHGQLPYRDFVFVQPPGIMLLMAPVALLAKVTGTATGLVIGRILTMGVGTVSIVAVGLLVRHRGMLAVLISCGIAAVHPNAVMAAHTILVEPWLVLFCLLGALAIFDGDRLTTSTRRAAWAGAAFGFAGVVEAWAIVPVLVLVALGIRRPRRTLAFAAGVTAGFGIPTVPFAALAPASFYNSVVTAQIGSRANAFTVYVLYRLRLMTGVSVMRHAPGILSLLGAALIVGFVLAAALVAWWLLRRPPAPLDWFAAATGVIMAVLFLWPPQFHYHFVGFLVPFMGMTVGLAAARLMLAVRLQGLRRRAASLARSVPAALAALAVLVGAGLQLHSESRLHPTVTPAQLALVRRLVPPGACVLADQVAYIVAADRFVARSPDCPAIDDGTGVNYALSHGLSTGTGAGSVASVAALWRSAFAHSQYVWLSVHAYKRIPWIPSIQAYFHAHFTRIRAAGHAIRLYRRRR
jgi:Glycosyltransferase family 87